jgi:hypothetical protein
MEKTLQIIFPIIDFIFLKPLFWAVFVWKIFPQSQLENAIQNSPKWGPL